MKAVPRTSQSNSSTRKSGGRSNRARNQPNSPIPERMTDRSDPVNLTEEPFIAAQSSGQALRSPAGGPESEVVHMEVTLPAAHRVCIAGSFNGWNPEGEEFMQLGSDKWAKDLILPPGVYEYRLVVDGQWMPDPDSSRSVPNPFGEPNSVLMVGACESARI
jgi:hypothetical protein